MKHSRIGRAVPAFMVAMLVSLWLAPAAHAQLGGGVGSAVGGVGDAVGGTVDGAVGGVTDGLEGGSNGSSTDDGGDGGSGEDGGGLVGGVVTGVEKTLEAGKEGVKQIAEDTGDTLGNVGSETVSGTVETVEGTLGTIDDGRNKKQRSAGSKDREGSRTSSPATDRVVVLGNSLADALEADNRSVAVTTSAHPVTYAYASAPTADESLINQLGKIATEAVRQAAFPLALTLMVIGFLMVQNRLDRKDPKLALAPVDSEQDLLSFT